MTVPCLSIAGSDPSGGAGIQADLKTFAAHGVYGMSVITAVTVQNTLGVSAVHSVPADIVAQQLHAVLSDIPPAAIKIGMLNNADTIQAIVDELSKFPTHTIVLDPVLVSSSGRALLEPTAIQLMLEKLLPLSTIVTPNIDELQVLSDTLARTSTGAVYANQMDANQLEESAQRLAQTMLNKLGIAPAILAKGGHLKGDAIDVLLLNGTAHHLHNQRINNPNNHGTGCILSSAIAANLAQGLPLAPAVSVAKQYLTQALKKRLDLGAGIGPLEH